MFFAGISQALRSRRGALKRIAVMTSGGDSPGMNCAIRSVVRTGINMGLDVYGIEAGYKGMIEGNITLMKHSDVSNIISRGGTILRTARSKEFMTNEGMAKAAANLKKHNIDGLVVIGGDGSLRGAKSLEEGFGIKTAGIPGSIDNDLCGTDYSLGTDTALNVIMSCVDMINNTASSHGRTFIIEVMGRNCGYLAVISAIATGADAVIIPERTPDMDAIVSDFKKRLADGKTRNILIVAEGAGSSYDYGKIIEDAGLEARISVLGHIQRGGSPTCFDRNLGSRMGLAAVEGLVAGSSGFMTGLNGNDMRLVPYAEVCSEHNIITDATLNLLKRLG